jgi:hypothetical protein
VEYLGQTSGITKKHIQPINAMRLIINKVFRCIVGSIILLTPLAAQGGYYSELTSISPSLLDEGQFIIIGTISSNIDFTKTDYLSLNQILINVHVVKVLKGNIGSSNILVAINKDLAKSYLRFIDLACLTQKQEVLMVLNKNKKNDGYFFEKPGNWLIWPNAFTFSSSNPLDIIRSLLDSKDKGKYTNDYENNVKSSLIEHSINNDRIASLIASYKKIYSDQYISLAENFGENISSNLVTVILGKLDNKSNCLPNEIDLIVKNEDVLSLDQLLNAYRKNKYNNLEKEKLDSIICVIVSKLSPFKVKILFPKLINLGSQDLLDTVIQTMNTYPSQFSIENYAEVFQISTDPLIKYHAYYGLKMVDKTFNPENVSLNDFKKNPAHYLDEWAPIVQKLFSSLTKQ